jgi:hypothetical protein
MLVSSCIAIVTWVTLGTANCPFHRRSWIARSWILTVPGKRTASHGRRRPAHGIVFIPMIPAEHPGPVSAAGEMATDLRCAAGSVHDLAAARRTSWDCTATPGLPAHAGRSRLRRRRSPHPRPGQELGLATGPHNDTRAPLTRSLRCLGEHAFALFGPPLVHPTFGRQPRDTPLHARAALVLVQFRRKMLT